MLSLGINKINVSQAERGITLVTSMKPLELRQICLMEETEKCPVFAAFKFLNSSLGYQNQIGLLQLAFCSPAPFTVQILLRLPGTFRGVFRGVSRPSDVARPV